jgi:oxygen-dependent protoporphyrinogen oxidase
MKPVAIIGAGVTGLTAAFYLKRKGVPVTVYEASDRAGGVIQSIRENGYLAEFGPNTLLEVSPRIVQLVRDAGVESRRLYSHPDASARYLVRYRRPITMPASPFGFFATPLFSLGAKLAIVREPFVARRTDGKEESVGEFVRRRLNQEFLDHAIDPLVAGVYAGDPNKLSVPHAFPKLAQIEARYGSLIKGQIFGARERKKRAEVAKDRAPKFSFDEGLQVLPDALRQALGADLRLRCEVLRVIQEGGEWVVDAREGGQEFRAAHSCVIYAGTAYRLAELRTVTAKPLDLRVFSEVRHPPVASVVLGFRREDVAHSARGFGMLIPRVEGFNILGTIFSSSLFPNRAPAGHVTLTSYIGGERQPELASLPAERLTALALADLQVLLGVRGKPTYVHTAFYPRAIPQYNVGYGRYRDQMASIEKDTPGFFLVGHYRDGVSLSDSLTSGMNAADRVEEFLKRRAPAAQTAPATA